MHGVGAGVIGPETSSAREVLISTSIQSADQARLAEAVDAVGTSDRIHLDVMDNHFVPRITGGLAVAAALVRHGALPLDCHLQIADPDRWAPAYAEAGARAVSFHAEASRTPVTTLRSLRAAGAEAGLALNPSTPVDAYAHLLGEADTLLLLAVEPTAYGSEPLIDLVLPQVRRARQWADDHHPRLRVQIDGGVSEETVERCAEAGADVFTPGLSVFTAADPAAAVTALRERAERGLVRGSRAGGSLASGRGESVRTRAK
ncbi:ribulose-phosphate 3-epimerase [Streptomyces sp. ODS28]|uniref:ribulose-phosphate 3-epimerase n=1 Tax=Streptomyces sp. ODS28 TaxID=3136688 RepID=UPI0031EE386B